MPGLTRNDFDHPTVTGRIGFRPNESWDFGFSGSDGSYLQPEAQSMLPRPTGRPPAPQIPPSLAVGTT